MKNTYIPEGYAPSMNIKETEIAIKNVKDFFEKELAKELKLTRVSAPLFVNSESGLNDNLNGVERPVRFDLKEVNGVEVEIVHSLAKWKRFALGRYKFQHGEGLYTDMNAIRRDEVTDNIHSIFVDQWDWEKIIYKEERTVEQLKDTVKAVYRALKATEEYVGNKHTAFEKILPEEIFFITAQELEDMYPNLTSKEREYEISKLKGAVFIMQIGGVLKSGEKHDGRAPDYDDWKLNGDIIVYYPLIDIALELSSMGIRVDEDTLKEQLEISGCPERALLPFQKALLDKELPYTVGGGIGQSRMCMFFLKKAHIGEVQASIWPDEVVKYVKDKGVCLL